MGPRVCQLDFSHLVPYIFKNAPDNFSSYVAGYHISWKTSTKKVRRQNQQVPTTKEGACIKYREVQVYDLKGVQGETEQLKFAEI